jgi:hypothetical protein
MFDASDGSEASMRPSPEAGLYPSTRVALFVVPGIGLFGPKCQAFLSSNVYTLTS